MSKHLLIILCIVFASCKNNTPNEQLEKKDTVAHIINETNCYFAAKDRDTAFFTLHRIGQKITGKLDFMAYESDNRMGTITSGEMKGDTLFAQYNSAQEGMESVCEIALLKKDSAYILSNDFYGGDNYLFNADVTKGTFKDKHHIKFDGIILKKTPCNNIIP